MINNWIKIFLYQLKKNKLFTILNTLGLSLGIAGLIFAILYWNDEQSYNAWNPEKGKVMHVVSYVSVDTYWSTSVATLEPYLQKSFPELDSYCYLNQWYYNEIIQYKNKKEIVPIIDAQKTFFKFFPFEFIKGNSQNPLPDKNSIAISDQTAEKLFGNEEPIGKEVTYSGRKLVVRGVYKISGKSSLEPEAVTNLIDSKLEEDKDQWGNFTYGLLLKLKNPSDSEKVAFKLKKLMSENRELKWAKEQGITLDEWKKQGGFQTQILLEPLENARLHSKVDGYAEGQGNYQFLMIMVGLSVLILILSIVNYINLATANAIQRAKEVGVRKILGASKSNIVKQFIFETVLITTFSILLALVIVELSLPYYNEFLGKTLLIHGSQFYIQLIVIFLIVIIVAGIFPSVYVSNFETLKVLKGNFGRSKSGVWLRNAMLILQFGIASFFIIGSYIVYQQVNYLQNKELGFKGEQIIQIDYRNPYDHTQEGVREKLLSRYLTIKQELSKINGVKQVATGSFSFGSGASSSSSFSYNDVTIQGQNMGMDFGMLDMMNIKIKKGRGLSEKFASDSVSSILINETAEKMMNEKDVLGKEINWNGKKLKVVGVVADFHLNGPHNEIPPMAFFHFKTIDWMIFNVNKIYVKVNPEELETVKADIEKFWIKKVDGDYPFTYDFVDKHFARTYETYVKQKNLFSLLNVIVILIALFGLFSLASYSIQRRMKEIAIRKTLGAETKTLLKDLSKQYIVFCLIGFLLALFPVYFLLGKWLENFVYRIDITLMPFIIGFVILLILTLIVVLSKAYQATKLDVLNYLKYE